MSATTTDDYNHLPEIMGVMAGMSVTTRVCYDASTRVVYGTRLMRTEEGHSIAEMGRLSADGRWRPTELVVDTPFPHATLSPRAMAAHQGILYVFAQAEQLYQQGEPHLLAARSEEGRLKIFRNIVIERLPTDKPTNYGSMVSYVLEVERTTGRVVLMTCGMQLRPAWWNTLLVYEPDSLELLTATRLSYRVDEHLIPPNQAFILTVWDNTSAAARDDLPSYHHYDAARGTLIVLVRIMVRHGPYRIFTMQVPVDLGVVRTGLTGEPCVVDLHPLFNHLHDESAIAQAEAAFENGQSISCGGRRYFKSTGAKHGTTNIDKAVMHRIGVGAVARCPEKLLLFAAVPCGCPCDELGWITERGRFLIRAPPWSRHLTRRLAAVARTARALLGLRRHGDPEERHWAMLPEEMLEQVISKVWALYWGPMW